MGDSNPQNGKDKLPSHIEDTLEVASPGDPNNPIPSQHDSSQMLNDDQLLKGGLVPVQAWIRTLKSETAAASPNGVAPPQQSANADRVKRYKENKAASGIKQLNVIAPEDAHPVLKEIAEKTRAGTPVAEAIVEITASVLRRDEDKHPSEPGAINRRGNVLEAKDEDGQSSKATPQATKPPEVSCLQECERERDALQTEVSRLRQQAAVGQKVLDLTGWRRELVSRLIGVRFSEHSVAATGTTKYQRRFFIFKKG